MNLFAGESSLLKSHSIQHSSETVSGIESIQLRQDDSVVVTSEPCGISLTSYPDLLYYIQVFLSLILLEPLFPSRMCGIIQETNNEIEIFFPLFGTHKPYYGRIIPEYAFFTHDEIKNEFETLVRYATQSINMCAISSLATFSAR